MVKNVVFVVLAFLSINLMISCGGKKNDQIIPPVNVSLMQVSIGDVTIYDQYPAAIVPFNQVDLRAQVTGYITSINFKDGDFVTKGQILYRIDRQEPEANYEQAVANLNVAKANLVKAQEDADKYNDLWEHDAIAKQLVDHANADLKASKMEVSAAKATVDRMNSDVKFSTIYAPYSGTIGISLVRLGTLVTANQTILNTLSTENPIAVDVAINQKDIPRFMKLKQSGAKDSTFTLLLPDNSIYPIVGKIYLIDRAVDPQTGNIKMRLEFENNNTLRAGMNCNLRVKNNSTQSSDKILIPAKSVTEQMGEYFVFVLSDSSKVLQRKVKLGEAVNDKIIVKDGLKVGERIVIEGTQRLKNGSKVKVN